MFLYYFFNSKGGRCGWGLEVELKEGKNPEQDGVEVFFLIFFFLVVVGAGGVTQTGRQGGNYNPWFRLSYAGK